MDEKPGLTVQAPAWDAERRLRAGEKLFRRMIDSSPAAMVMADAKGRIALVNARTEQLFGYARAELIGRSIEILVPDRFRDQHSGFRRSFMSDPQARPMGARRDLCGRRKDGSECPVEIGLNPLVMPEGTFVLATIVDITERQRAEEHRELLLRELNHRSKNTLSIVQSIASQALRQAHSLEEFGRTFSGRVRALAAAHDLLLSPDGRAADVDLRELLERTLAPIAPRERVDLQGESVTLPAAAVSLGMIFHELATNASKYGAFSTPQGHVQVGWSLGGHGSGQPLTIEWRESGGPPAVAPSPDARGFGSRLIENLARPLGAGVEREWSATGLRFRLTLPFGWRDAARAEGPASA